MVQHTEFPFKVVGNPNSDTVLVFLAGFPDDTDSGFTALIEALQGQYTCVSLCLPGMEHLDGCAGAGGQRKRWGYDFPEVLALLHRSIVRHTCAAHRGGGLSGESTTADKEVILIVHDWGSIVGMLYQIRYPHMVARMVVLDVGILQFPQLQHLFHMVFYQLSFALLYAFSQLVSVSVGNALFKAFLALLSVFRCLGPAPHDRMHRPWAELHVEMCFLYFYFYIPSTYGLTAPEPLKTKGFVIFSCKTRCRD